MKFSELIQQTTDSSSDIADDPDDPEEPETPDTTIRRFVAVGESGKASYSETGISWITKDHNNGKVSVTLNGD